MRTENKLNTKTMLIPNMSDHVQVMSAALRVHDIPNVVLPRTDDESFELGLDLVSGKECLPCLTTTGDIIRFVKRTQMDPAQAVLLMPTTAGPCRFGQYITLQRHILDEHGLSEIEIVSPSAANSYLGFGERPTALRQLMWQGVVATDLLQKLLHEYRPYELNPGDTERLYRQGLDRIAEAIEANGGRRLVDAMKWIAGQFEALPVDRSRRRPIIGLIGEFYLRFSEYSNQGLIRQVEAAGGEVMIAPMMEWLYFTNWGVKTYTWYSHMFREFVLISLADMYQRYHERRLIGPVEHLLTYPHETPVARVMETIRPYYDPFLGTEAALSVGKAIDFFKHGLSGILNVMPFSCMPGIITAGLALRIREDLDHIPWLDLSYDAQGGTNINTRLEAFMYQAREYRRRRALSPTR